MSEALKMPPGVTFQGASPKGERAGDGSRNAILRFSIVAMSGYIERAGRLVGSTAEGLHHWKTVSEGKPRASEQSA